MPPYRPQMEPQQPGGKSRDSSDLTLETPHLMTRHLVPLPPLLLLLLPLSFLPPHHLVPDPISIISISIFLLPSPSPHLHLRQPSLCNPNHNSSPEPHITFSSILRLARKTIPWYSESPIPSTPKHAIMSADAAPSPLTKVDSAVQGLSSSPPKDGAKHRRVSSSAAGVMNINDLGMSPLPSLTTSDTGSSGSARPSGQD
jgi:hypothetical protein